jgi:hypothetical protein
MSGEPRGTFLKDWPRKFRSVTHITLRYGRKLPMEQLVRDGNDPHFVVIAQMGQRRQLSRRDP